MNYVLQHEYADISTMPFFKPILVVCCLEEFLHSIKNIFKDFNAALACDIER